MKGAVFPSLKPPGFSLEACHPSDSASQRRFFFSQVGKKVTFPTVPFSPVRILVHQVLFGRVVRTLLLAGPGPHDPFPRGGRRDALPPFSQPIPRAVPFFLCFYSAFSLSEGGVPPLPPFFNPDGSTRTLAGSSALPPENWFLLPTGLPFSFQRKQTLLQFRSPGAVRFFFGYAPPSRTVIPVDSALIGQPLQTDRRPLFFSLWHQILDQVLFFRPVLRTS